MEGAADVAETEYTPFSSEPDAVPVRLIVRRVKPTPGSQLALFTTYSYHAFITDRDGDTLGLEVDHRRHAEIENAIRDLKYGVGLNHLPSGASPPTPPGWRCRWWLTTWHAGRRVSVWASRWQPPRPCGDVFSPWLDASPVRPADSLCISPDTGPGKTSSAAPWKDCAPCHYPPDRSAPVAAVRPTTWQNHARLAPIAFSCNLSRGSGPTPHLGRSSALSTTAKSLAQHGPPASEPRHSFHTPSIHGLTSSAVSYRWIRAH